MHFCRIRARPAIVAECDASYASRPHRLSPGTPRPGFLDHVDIGFARSTAACAEAQARSQSTVSRRTGAFWRFSISRRRRATPAGRVGCWRWRCKSSICLALSPLAQHGKADFAVTHNTSDM
jgi:hypothetical protein